MSKAVLISINPPWAKMTCTGAKTVEWRHKPLPTGKHYVYETKRIGGVGAVIGEFTVTGNRVFRRGDTVPWEYVERGCVPVGELSRYAGYDDRARLAANFLENPVLYPAPIPLQDFTRTLPDGTVEALRFPPQSWLWTEELTNG